MVYINKLFAVGQASLFFSIAICLLLFVLFSFSLNPTNRMNTEKKPKNISALISSLISI